MTKHWGDIELGMGFWMSYFTERGVEGHTGLIIYGPAAPGCIHKSVLGGGICGGGLHFESSQYAVREGRPRWKVEQEDPLTLSPSIACKCGGQHGYIRNGRYVKA